MAGKGKILLIAGVAVVGLGAAAGGTFAVLEFWPHKDTGQAKAAAPPPPKPLYFTDVANVTVSIPPDTGSPPTSFVQVGVQFSTYDQTAVASFTALQPIIKADIIGVLMGQTGNAMADPKTREAIAQSCLDISNKVLAQNANFKTTPAFTAAYITNLVVQE
jgi:flagellar basal body-associated protein FliL